MPVDGWRDDDGGRNARGGQGQRGGAGAICTQVPHAVASILVAVAVSMTRRVPASSHTGCGYGVRSSQIPPSAVAAIRYRSSSLSPGPCQDWAGTCTPGAEGPAALVELP